MTHKLTIEEAKALRWYGKAIGWQAQAVERGDAEAVGTLRYYLTRLRRYQAWIKARLGIVEQASVTFDEELGTVEVLS